MPYVGCCEARVSYEIVVFGRCLGRAGRVQIVLERVWVALVGWDVLIAVHIVLEQVRVALVGWDVLIAVHIVLEHLRVALVGWNWRHGRTCTCSPSLAAWEAHAACCARLRCDASCACSWLCAAVRWDSSWAAMPAEVAESRVTPTSLRARGGSGSNPESGIRTPDSGSGSGPGRRQPHVRAGCACDMRMWS